MMLLKKPLISRGGRGSAKKPSAWGNRLVLVGCIGAIVSGAWVIKIQAPKAIKEIGKTGEILNREMGNIFPASGEMDGGSPESLKAAMEARRALTKKSRELNGIIALPPGEEKREAIRKFMRELNGECEGKAGETGLRESVYRMELMLEEIRAAQEEGCGKGQKPRK